MYKRNDSLEMLKCFSLEIISLLFEGYLQKSKYMILYFINIYSNEYSKYFVGSFYLDIFFSLLLLYISSLINIFNAL